MESIFKRKIKWINVQKMKIIIKRWKHKHTFGGSSIQSLFLNKNNNFKWFLEKVSTMFMEISLKNKKPLFHLLIRIYWVAENNCW